MEKFKFRAPQPAPKTNRNSTASNHRHDEADAGDDDLWMDDIDEQTLLQASQLAEADVPTKVGKIMI